jgi:hypothetical protein
MSSSYPYRDAGRLSQIVRGLFITGIGMALLSLVSSWMQYDLSTHSFTMEEALANDMRERLVAHFHVGFDLILLIFFGIWVVRVNRNVRALGATGLPITPGWAFGFYFIPILCLWKPYQAMRDMWKASHDPAQWQNVQSRATLAIWWSLAIFQGLLTSIIIQIEFQKHSIIQLQDLTMVTMASHLVQVPAYLVMFVLVGQVLDAQQMTAHKLILPALQSGSAPVGL